MFINIEDHFNFFDHKNPGWYEIVCDTCDWYITGPEKTCEYAAYDHWDSTHIEDPYRIHVRKIRLPQHKGFSKHRLDNIGRWETEVVWQYGLYHFSFEFIYQGYEDSWSAALSRGYEEVEKHQSILEKMNET